VPYYFVNAFELRVQVRVFDGLRNLLHFVYCGCWQRPRRVLPISNGSNGYPEPLSNPFSGQTKPFTVSFELAASHDDDVPI
jgi:hypothetical protein